MPLPCLRLLTAAALVLLPALAAQEPAQEAPAPPPGAYTITRNVRLVVLDAVVLDAKGNPVTDLQQSDFHITEDNDPQAIRDFEAPGRYTPPPSVTIDSTADLDRLAPRAPVNIVLLDEFNTHFDDMAFARYSLKSWLEKQPAKLDTPSMLIAVTLEKFTVLHDYTQNKEEILKALDHHFVVDPWQLRNGSWLSERYSTALVSLRRVSEAVIGHPGHKTMIWVGRGFPTLNISKMPVDDQTASTTPSSRPSTSYATPASRFTRSIPPASCSMPANMTRALPAPNRACWRPSAATPTSPPLLPPREDAIFMAATMWIARSAAPSAMAPASIPSPTAPPTP